MRDHKKRLRMLENVHIALRSNRLADCPRIRKCEIMRHRKAEGSQAFKFDKTIPYKFNLLDAVL